MQTQLKSSHNQSDFGGALAVLREVLETQKISLPDGSSIQLTANISEWNSNALRQFVELSAPSIVVEIGMAYGVSTLSILAGLQNAGVGQLISVDPYVGWPTGRIAALHLVERAHALNIHRHLHLHSHEGLTELGRQGLVPDFVYIDGNHNFEYVLTDFFLADKLMKPGGVIAFNDCGWKSVHAVIQFLKRNRRYRELDVGLPKTFRARNVAFSLIKRIQGRSTYDRYFRKIDDWEPPQGFFSL